MRGPCPTLITVPQQLRRKEEKEEIAALNVDGILEGLELLDGEPLEATPFLTDLGLECLRREDEADERECVLGRGHSGPHYAWLGERDLTGLWLRWTPESEPEPVAIPYCGESYDPDHPGGDDETCGAFKGHPGPHRWGFLVEWEDEDPGGDESAETQ